MGSEYNWNINPIHDYFLSLVMEGTDISDKSFEGNLYSDISFIISEIVDDEYLSYLDFEIRNNNGIFAVIGLNVVSALWLSGIFVEDLDAVSKTTIFLVGNKKYKYNKKNNELTYTIIDE